MRQQHAATVCNTEGFLTQQNQLQQNSGNNAAGFFNRFQLLQQVAVITNRPAPYVTRG